MNAHWIALGTTLLAGTLPAFGSDTPPPDGLLAPVTVEERPARRVAYVEQTGHFQANPDIYDVLLRKLLDWAIPAGIWDFPDRTLIVCIYPDDPETTPPDRQRLWFGITIGETDTPPDGIRTLTLPDTFQDQDKPERQYAEAGLDAAAIVTTALRALGSEHVAGGSIRA